MIMRQCLFRPNLYKLAETPFSILSVGHYILDAPNSEYMRDRPFLQFFWIVSGRMKFVFNGKTEFLEANQLALYLPGMIHDIQILSPQTDYRWWTMDGDLAELLIARLGFDHAGVYDVSTMPTLLHDELLESIADLTPHGEQRAALINHELLLHAAKGPAMQSNDALIHKIKMHIDSHWSDPTLSVEYLADWIGMNRSSMTRLFQKNFALSPKAYLMNKRLQNAMSMLRESDSPLQKLALDCGWSDPNYFSRCIKAQTGLSPKEFRKS